MIQTVIFVLYFVFVYDQKFTQAITDYRIFLVKLTCCFLMHLTVSPHLKSSLQLFRYIIYPTSFEHKDSDRLLSCLVLTAKVLSATCAEVFLILCLSRIDELGPYQSMLKNGAIVPDSMRAIHSVQLNEVIFVFIVYMCVL